MYTSNAYRDHNFIVGVLLLLQNAWNQGWISQSVNPA